MSVRALVHRGRSRRRVAAALGVAVLTVAGVISAPSGSASAAPLGTYYKAVPTCAPAAPGHVQCFAERRVTVKAASAAAAAKMDAVPAAARVAGIAYGPAGGFTPADLGKVYGVNPAASTTQTVATVDAYNDPNALADLDTFDIANGLPTESSSSLRIVAQDGTSDLPANDTQGWSTETSLDLDALRGLCHHCKIILVEANSSSNADVATAENEAVALGAREVSNSFGDPETDSTDPITASEIAAFNHPGVVITASAGDDGYYDWDYSNYNFASSPPTDVQNSSSDAPSIPASLPTVVAVGGTTLQVGDTGTRSSESVWNENGTFDNAGFLGGAPQGATGGGCSLAYTAQKWQYDVSNYGYTGCGTKRLVTDISALADPYTGYDVYDSYAYTSDTSVFTPGWGTFGGTSLSSPLIAAMWALAGGAGGVSYPSLSLYGHFKSANSSLYDVTTGGNGFCDGTSAGQCGQGFPSNSPNDTTLGILDCAWSSTSLTVITGNTRACDAAPGYDGPSGVGTPKGLSVFQPMQPTARVTTPSTVTHNKTASFKGTTSTDPFPGGSITSYTWSWGNRKTSTGSAPTHKYTKKGTFTIKLYVKDNYGRVSLTASKTISVK